MYAGGRSVTVYSGLSGTTDTTDLEAQFRAVVQTLHGLAVSISTSKQQYEQSHDPRWLDSIKSQVAVFQTVMARAKDLNRQLTDQEMPSSFDLFIADVGMWLGEQTKALYEGAKDVVGAATDTVKQLPKVAGALANPVVLLAIAGVAFLALGGNRLIPTRR